MAPPSVAQPSRETPADQPTLDDIRQRLTSPDPFTIVNEILQLYLLRQRGDVRGLLVDLWEVDGERYPDLNWQEIEKPPARVALAHTLARIGEFEPEPLLAFIRSNLDHADPFTQANAVTALAFVGEDSDIEAMTALAANGADYAAEAAIKALALHGGPRAKDALLQLRVHYAADAYKQTIIDRVIAERYPEHYQGRAGPRTVFEQSPQ